MNEKLQYAEMLDIPSSTCNLTFKPTKKRKKQARNQLSDQPKEMLIDKVNANSSESEEKYASATDYPLVKTDNYDEFENQPIEENAIVDEQDYATNYVKVTRTDRQQKKAKFKFSIVGFQVVIVLGLLATILITNSLLPNSAINTFIYGAVKPESQQTVTTDARLFSDFDPALPVEDASVIKVEEGVMSFSKSGSLYSPCDGKISSLLKAEDGTYTVEISHSDNFKTVFTGLNFAYGSVGDKVFSTLPVGYVAGLGAKMCFFDGENQTITNYQLVDNDLQWVV